MQEKLLKAIRQTREALQDNGGAHWVLGFSGGKDSTALLKIFVSALSDANQRPKKIDIIYCDTGVENPILDRYVKSLFGRLRKNNLISDLGVNFNILKADVENRFFVKIIGRGYPPPTNHFRWCTKNLRINPVTKFIREAAKEDAIVVLGMRSSESHQRDRSLRRAGFSVWQRQREGASSYRMFLPIIEFDVVDVWDAIFALEVLEHFRDRLNHLCLSRCYVQA